MKQKKHNVGKSPQASMLLTLLLIVLCLTNTASLFAQPNVYAHNSDIFLASNQQKPNTAMIDYSPNCACGNAQLTAIVSNTTGTPIAVLTVDDGVNPPISVSIPHGMLPDVVIGNNINNSSNYLVGVVYQKTTGSGTDVYLDIYEVVQPGTLSFAVNYVSTTQITSSGQAVNDPHIDIIAEYGNTFLGLPLCDKFVIEYCEGTSLVSPYGYYASLNNPSGGTYSSSLTTTSCTGADVAAIQRLNMGTVDDMALFIYIDNGGLEYREWNITQNTYSTPLAVDAGGNPFVRIDAIDDYHINDPNAINPLAVWCAVQELGTTDVTIYNNLLAYGGTDISTGVYKSPTPVITAGPCSQYTVAYHTADGNDDIVAQNIDWSTGLLSNSNIYQVNYSPVPPIGDWTAVGTTCNALSPSYAQNFVTCWDRNSALYYKYATCSMGFKPGAITNVNTSIHWQLSPNPATDHIVLSKSSGTLQNYHYTITDVVGKVVQTADLTKADQQINVSSLSTGLFLINIYERNNKVKTIKFTKG